MWLANTNFKTSCIKISEIFENKKKFKLYGNLVAGRQHFTNYIALFTYDQFRKDRYTKPDFNRDIMRIKKE